MDTVAPSHLPSTSKIAGSAAESAARNKSNKYSHLADNYIFVPFAVETLGPWCREAKDLISTIGRCLATLEIVSSYDSVQRGNAVSILATFPESSYFDEIFCL